MLKQFALNIMLGASFSALAVFVVRPHWAEPIVQRALSFF